MYHERLFDTLAGLARYDNSRYVLAARPRRNPYMGDTVGFEHGMKVMIFIGTLRWNGHRYVVPDGEGLDYDYDLSGEVRAFGDHWLVVTYDGMAGVRADVDLSDAFAIEENVVRRCLPGIRPIIGRSTNGTDKS